MVIVKENVSYPMFSTTSWWTIRRKFIHSMPTRITDSFLAGLLSIGIDSARNLLLPLKKMGLLDNDGKPTERAARWRDNELYASVCEEIRKEIYPSELLELFPESDSSRTDLENWFARAASVGTQAKKKMATFYLLLAEADSTKQDSATSSKTPKATKSTPATSKANTSSTKVEKKDKAIAVAGVPRSTIEEPRAVERNTNNMGPSLHIDIQIHISSDASFDQVDQIFASMAKHLYRSKVSNEQ